MITNALFVEAGLAGDPFASGPVVQWRDVRDEQTNQGAWPVTADHGRPRWGWTPHKGVGPLWFGMNPQQVATALNENVPTARLGHYPWPMLRRPGQWYLTEDRFDTAGVSAHYWPRMGLPTLGAVTVHGRTGPQVTLSDIQLIGRTVSHVDAALIQYIEQRQVRLLYGCGGDLGSDTLNMSVRATRAGDTTVSEARFFAPEWEDHG